MRKTIWKDYIEWDQCHRNLCNRLLVFIWTSANWETCKTLPQRSFFYRWNILTQTYSRVRVYRKRRISLNYSHYFNLLPDQNAAKLMIIKKYKEKKHFFIKSNDIVFPITPYSLNALIVTKSKLMIDTKGLWVRSTRSYQWKVTSYRGAEIRMIFLNVYYEANTIKKF